MSDFNYKNELINKINFKQHKPLSDIVYDALKDAILDGTIPLGERINENYLAELLSISRTPIRKAVKKLTEEGLTESIPQYGTVIKYVSTDKIDEIYKIRLALELVLHQEVLKKISNSELKELKILSEYMIKYEKDDNIEHLTEILNKFNNMISTIANMSTLNILLEDLNTYFKNFRNFSFASKERRKIATKEHAMIIRAIESEDIEVLNKIVSKHIRHAHKAAIDTFARNDNSYIKDNIVKISCDNLECPIHKHHKR
ncbi:hypothetical protein BG261_01520 [Floricoccus tropicus]|uniref:HTH gntR-type domain-containing protein n=1 Tax=Floricoccus tropicus TaxID=1859473 RepID=A0A1E8GMP4_9LACT|nr:GntR family transcriptional regulator [Floricoccus tropicus]OFI49286.1 hypothetical protein BG261_01520 [Floricoccus tropicus]